MRKTNVLLAAPLALALMSGTALAAGQSVNAGANGTVNNSSTAGTTATGTANTSAASTSSTNRANKGDVADARQIIDGAVKVVDKMKTQKHAAQLLQKAKGIYIVPSFGRGGLIVGGRGGAGVMLAKHGGHWTDPAFFNFGGVSIGAQAGGSGGSVAFILMSQDAVNAFKNGNQFSLNTGAGLSIVNYSANAQASAGKGDIVLWSDTSGAYAGATVSVSDIVWAGDNNRGYYGKKVSPQNLIDGKVAMRKGMKLKTALSS